MYDASLEETKSGKKENESGAMSGVGVESPLDDEDGEEKYRKGGDPPYKCAAYVARVARDRER